MAAMFHVFVEGPTDGSPAGVQRLAQGIAAHYGLPVADITARIATGRFRVKGNVDRATADQYVGDLQRLGARCVVEEASPNNSRPTPFPATRPSTPALGAPRVSPPIAGAYQSGLSAAFSGSAPAASLGALEGDGGAFSLSSVDGNDAVAPAPPPAVFEPPVAIAAPKPANAAKPAKPAAPKDLPVDLFAPPDAADGELKMELADDEIERNARKRATTPPASVPVVAAPEAASRRSQPSIQPQNVVAEHHGSGVLGDPRKRFVAGVVLAIAIGFIPAHLLARSREAAAFATIDETVVALQQEADTPEAYASLDRSREVQLERKHTERRDIAMMALLVWGVVGGGLAYVWFRRIPWDRFD